MPEKPTLKNEQIIHCLHDQYGLDVEKISTLSLGADVNTIVYRVRAKNGKNYFLKVRRGNFNEASVIIPSFLSDSGIEQIIPPLMSREGQFWASIYPFILILYPFVEGHAGLDIKMSEQQWIEFGRALKQLHTTHFPPDISGSIQRDDFSSRWRDRLKMHLVLVDSRPFHQHLRLEAADFLRSKGAEMLELGKRAERLARLLQEELPEFVLCHSDVHGYNLLIDSHGALYIVDWDSLLFAPKERDLMFIGGGHGNSGYTPEQEEAMFYQGYGETKVNPIAIAYYRYERIIVDIVDDCDIIFLSDEGAAKQTDALQDLKNKFLPDKYIDVAYRSDKLL